MRTEIRLCGFGGQGLILASKILAQAAIMDGKIVTQYQTYGAQVRGGTIKGDIVISDSEISYPTVLNPDLFIALSQDAYDKYICTVKDDGKIIIDPFYVHNVTKDHIAIPFFETVKEKLSSTLPLNMVVIAFIAEFTGVVSERSVHESVLKKVPPHTVDLNIQALRLGADIAKRYG